jgi:NTP pyrophosphatase (non-canonical NTP hydrolase)
MRLPFLAEECLRISREHGFSSALKHDADSGTFCEKMMLIVSEISEALEEFRGGHTVQEVYYTPDKPDKPEGVPIELADAIIRILDFCHANGIDIEDAVLNKMKYNESRPFKHGKKF